ncbi:MAG TPA: polyprenyl synthetase family protein [Candidatus Acidoferrales bacterium]|nr:polyprenyl synthetase family protein [Candidatus Acidoferrales bacterium]
MFELVRDDLALVEQEIAAQTGVAIQPIAEIGSYLREGGGKRLRPALLLLAAGACGYRGESAIALGAVVEMIHSATLIHDDVIDGANTRRGRPSANARWGNHMSVLAGDWLYMQSFKVALRERNFAVLDILIDLTQNMVEGELLQLTCLGRMDLNEGDAADLAYRKTACLFSGCAELGAVLARQEEGARRAMAEYGRQAGMAFQLVDDLLDFTASSEKLGKPVLSDLKEGKVTLPLIFALQNGASGNGAGHDGHHNGRDLVAAVLREKGFESVRPEEITSLVRESGALERSRQLAVEYASRAKEYLEVCKDSEYRRALMSVPDFILDRES